MLNLNMDFFIPGFMNFWSWIHDNVLSSSAVEQHSESPISVQQWTSVCGRKIKSSDISILSVHCLEVIYPQRNNSFIYFVCSRNMMTRLLILVQKILFVVGIVLWNVCIISTSIIQWTNCCIFFIQTSIDPCQKGSLKEQSGEQD